MANMSFSFLNINLLKSKPVLTRFIHSSAQLSCKTKEGIQYHGFKYYPRYPDFQDPPYTPSKLFMLKKIRSLYGIPHWEKKILKELKLDGKFGQVVVVKNTPGMNKILYQIKHMVEITPITFPDGEPNESDAQCLGATKLDDFGVMRVSKSINPAEAPKLERPDLMTRPQSATLRRHLRMRWLSGMNDT